MTTEARCPSVVDDFAFTPQTVRDGRKLLKFLGRSIATESSARAWAPRWSEIQIFKLPSGGYMYAKLGASLVAHRPTCSKVSWRMKSWVSLEEGQESQAVRVPCQICQPVVGTGMDPHTKVEVTRYTAMLADSPAELLELLLKHVSPGGEVPTLVLRVIEQCRATDPLFDSYLTAHAISR